jgi:hypothetical protein
MAQIKIPELKQYIYRKLGHPVINVEVDETQLEDVIDEALKTFIESHYDACEIGYVELEVQAGVKEYTLPESVQDVLEVLNIEGESSSSFFFGDEPILINRQNVMNVPCGYQDVVSVEVYRQRLALIEDQFKVWILFEFNQISKKISFPEAPESNGIRVLKVAQAAVDTNDTGLVLDSLWLKNYAVALARIQWGVNLGKYSGAQLPGGVEINAADIAAQGEAERERLILELEEKYSLPPDPVFA